MAYSSVSSSLPFVRVANVLAAVCIWSLVAIPSNVFAQGPQGPAQDTELTFYVHERRSPPASLVLVAPVAGALSAVGWGSVVVIDNEVRATNATNSTYIGRQLGSVVVGSDNVTFHASYTYLLNTTIYNGSLTVAGITQSGKLAITGGTGSFTYVRGVAVVQTLMDTATAAVYEYTLALRFS